jgi:hypothetical protein
MSPTFPDFPEDPQGDAFRELSRKLGQLANDAANLRDGKYDRLRIATADDLPESGRGYEFTKRVRDLQAEFPGRVDHTKISAQKCP